MAKYFNTTAPGSFTVPQVTAGMGSVNPATQVADSDEEKKKKKKKKEVDHDDGVGNWGESDSELFGGGDST